MSTTHWPHRPPGPGADRTAWWEGTPRGAADLSRLRRELRAAVLRRHRPSDGDGDDLDALLLIFEELASNGLRHGLPPVHVLVTRVPTGWLLDVSDAAADHPPAPAIGRDAAAGGMGLSLVARLAAAHGWTVHEGRKHVWARIDTTMLPGPSNGASPPLRPGTRAAAEQWASADHGPARIRGVIDDGAAELGFRPALQVTGPLDELTSDVLTDLLVVLREALTNVTRHARVGSVDVEIAVTGDGVLLGVRDDGIGLAAAPKDGGLADLRRRAAWHGGTLSVQPEPAGGTWLTWAVPRPASAPQPQPPPDR
jgi:two-component sensor histidine kinase